MDYQLDQDEQYSRQVEKQYQLTVHNPNLVDQLFRESVDFLTKIYTHMYREYMSKKEVHFPQQEVQFHLHRFHVMAKHDAKKHKQFIMLLENIYNLVLWETITVHFPMHAELTIKSFLLYTTKIQLELWRHPPLPVRPFEVVSKHEPIMITKRCPPKAVHPVLAALYGPAKIEPLDRNRLIESFYKALFDCGYYDSPSCLTRGYDGSKFLARATKTLENMKTPHWPVQRTPSQQLYHQVIHRVKPQLFHDPNNILSKLKLIFMIPKIYHRSEQLWYLRTFKQIVRQGIEFNSSKKPIDRIYYRIMEPIEKIYQKTLKKYRVDILQQKLPLRPRILIYKYMVPYFKIDYFSFSTEFDEDEIFPFTILTKKSYRGTLVEP